MSRLVSDLLDSASATLGIPSSLTQRSAAARAAADGTDVDSVLTSWSGGAPPVTKPPPTPPTSTPQVDVGASSQPTATAVAVIEAPAPAPVIVEQVVYEEPSEPLEPASLRARLRIATRVGAWTGAVLGLVGFLVATAFWADSAAVTPDTGPVVQVDSTGTLIGITLVSLLFGAIVASFARTATSRGNPAMQLTGSKTATAVVGALLGLILGLGAGALLIGVAGSGVEGSDGLVQLHVLTTLALMVLGGAILGAVTAAAPQVFGTPVAIDEDDQQEVADVRARLGNAVTIPMGGALILLLLVLPFAYILIQSNHLTSAGAPLVAILVAGGILGFAALAGTKSDMRISLGDMTWALAGIGTVLVIVLAVLLFNSDGDHEGGEEGQAGVGSGGTVEIVAGADITFDAHQWTSEEGEITFVYTNGGNLLHTLLVEGHEDDLELRVSSQGDIDEGSITLGAGTYTVYCGIKGHREQGMEGTLTVEATGP